MTDNEMLTLAVSGSSLVVSIIALIRSSKDSSKANEISGEGLKLTHAQVELDLANHIKESKHRVEDFFTANGDFLARKESTLSEDEKEKRKRLIVAAKAKMEGYLNALDGACQKYIDGKIDKTRFKKANQRDIRQAVQSEEHKEFFPVGHAYNALMRVYEEWENPEKEK